MWGMRYALAVILFYAWAVRQFNDPWHWGHDLNGLYNHLSRSLAQGQLHLPIQPSKELLSAPNPYDPRLPDEWKLHDAVLFQGKYYLYHGVAPALLLFLPYRLIAGSDIYEGVAVLIFVSAAFLIQCLTIKRHIGRLDHWHVFALGLANSIPFLLHRVVVYEVAIASGVFCLSLAAFAISRKTWPLAGLAIGLAVMSRPHLGLALLPALWLAGRGQAIRLLAPFTICAAALATYNFARFGAPWEFGLRYLIAGPSQQTPGFIAANLWPTAYLYLLHPPQLLSEFPYLVLRREIPLHYERGLFYEYTIGIVWSCPILFGPWRFRGFEAAAGILIFAFLITTGWATQRYMVDFLPLLLLAALSVPNLPAYRKAAILLAIAANLWLFYLGPANGK
jgi:hypothetical protein